MGTPSAEWPLRSALWLCLGGWVGAYGLFAFVVAPTAFRVLPTPGDAGQLVGPVLRALHLYGMAAGALLGALAWALGRRGMAVWLPVCLAAVCGFSEFVISSEIVSVRPRDFGPASTPDAAAKFSSLHRASRILFGVTLAGAMALIALHARADTAHRTSEPDGALSP